MPDSQINGVISEKLVELHPGTNLYTSDLKSHPVNPLGCIVGDLFPAYYDGLPRPRPAGQFKVPIPQTDPPYYVHFNDGQLIQPPYLIMEGTVVPKKYSISYDMVTGHALKSDTDQVEAIKVLTKEFTLNDFNNMEGVVLTKEEWEADERSNLGEFKAALTTFLVSNL